MADRYFDKFPVISYSNNRVVDITRRVTLLDRVSRNPYTFFPYDIEDNERPDQFSDRYYGDSFKSWIVYLGNKITDPYYEWYLSYDELNSFIEKKYGSIYDSQQKVKHYRNNWENQENLTVSAYNALDANMKKYWNPNYGTGSNILSYSRKEIDWICNTNKIVTYAVANTAFVKDEIVTICLDGLYKGKGQVAQTSNTLIYVQHVSGYYQESDTLSITVDGYIHGSESNVNTSVTDVSTVVSNIEDNELNYWKPITYYDYEYEKNEYNKSVRIIDKDFQYVVVDNLIDLLKENE